MFVRVPGSDSVNALALLYSFQIWDYANQIITAQKIKPSIKNFCRRSSKFHKKTSALESLFNKVGGLKPCNFIKRRLQYCFFPVKFAKLLRTAFFTEYLRWLLPFFIKYERIRRKLRISSHLLKISLTASLLLCTETCCWRILRLLAVLRELQYIYDQIKQNIYKVIQALTPGKQTGLNHEFLGSLLTSKHFYKVLI